MQKSGRQDALKEVIAGESIASQADLVSRLSTRGFVVTQASVSRDLDELGIVKVNGTYALPLSVSPGSAFGRIAFDTAGDTLIVGRCSSGLASAITVKIDAAHVPEIVGTIAGDDTIFIAVKDGTRQIAAMAKLAQIFPAAAAEESAI